MIVNFPPNIPQKVQDVINRIPGVNISINEVGAEFTARYRDCCSKGILKEHGEESYEGTGILSAEIVDATIWGPPTISHEFDFGFAVIDVDFEVGVKLNADFSVSGTLGLRKNDCEVNETCGYGSLDASTTLTPSVSIEAIVCTETLWTTRRCAGIDITPASIEISISGSLRYNSSSACDGFEGEVKLLKIEFVANATCNGVGLQYRYVIYGGD